MLPTVPPAGNVYIPPFLAIVKKYLWRKYNTKYRVSPSNKVYICPDVVVIFFHGQRLDRLKKEQQMDANVYFLEQHLQSQEDIISAQNHAEEMAQQEIEDPTSKFYPWSAKNVYEALNEIRDREVQRIVNTYHDDKALARVIREVVIGYWFDNALEKK